MDHGADVSFHIYHALKNLPNIDHRLADDGAKAVLSSTKLVDFLMLDNSTSIFSFIL